MNDIIKELLSDISVGDRVSVRYGLGETQTVVIGKVTMLSESVLKLQKDSGGIGAFILDDLRSIESLEPQDAVFGGPTSEPQPPLKSQPQPAPQPGGQIMRVFVPLPPAQPYAYRREDLKSQIKALLRGSDNTELKKTINGVSDSIESAVKSRSLNEKYHNCRARILNTWPLCQSNTDFEAFYLFLALLAITAENYDSSAIEPLVRAKRYTLAAYAAAKGGRTDDAETLTLCSLLSGESQRIDRYIAQICLTRRDTAVLSELLRKHKDDNEACEAIASCVFLLYTQSRGKLKEDLTPYHTAYDAASRMLDAIPAEWKRESQALETWKRFQTYDYPVHDTDEQGDKFIGTIYYFYPEYYGFISPMHRRGEKDDIFFHIRQVCDDSENGILLRKALMLGMSADLEVSYALGVSPVNGRTAATRITLTGNGLRTLVQRASKNDGDRDHVGSAVQKAGEDGYSGLWPDVDPYSDFPYSDLLPLEDAGDLMASPLTWAKDQMDERRTVVRETVKDPQPKDPPLKDPPSPVTPLPIASPPKSKTISTPEPVNPDLHLIEKAKKAMKSGQLEEAEKAFDDAMRSGVFDDSAIGDFVTLCTTMPERTDKALQALEKYGSNLPAEKLLNLKITIYDKIKDYQMLCPLYESAFQAASTVSKKSHMLSRLIDAYVKLGNYEKALENCRRWEQLYQQNRFSAEAEKLRNFSSTIDRQKAICLYYLGDIEESKRIATDLVRINPADAAATSILNDTLEENYSDLEEYDEDLFISNEEADPQLSPFIRDMIQQADLSASLKSKNIRDGRYVGTAKQATQDIRSLLSRRSLSAKAKSDSLFAACKLLDQIEDRSYRKSRLAGRAVASWGDVMIAQAQQLDTGRMAYLYALKILVPTKGGAEQGWVDSYNRYIKSFFLAQHGARSLEEYINEQNNRRSRDAANTDVFKTGTIPEVLMRDFLNGVLLMINAIENQENLQNTFLGELYDQKVELRTAVCRQLAQFPGIQIDDNIGKEAFCKYMKSAAETQKEQAEQLRRTITEIGSVLMIQPLSGERMEQLDPERWSLCLTATDLKRLNTIYNRIIRRSQDYYASGEFDNRADCLRQIQLEIDSLMQSIRAEPTDISYSSFLPSLNQMYMKVSDKQDELYQTFLPKISIEETIPPFRNPNGQVELHFTVRNEQNYQSADSFRITGVFGADIQRSEATKTISSLRGGAEEELSLSVTLTEAAIETGSFVATVRYSYTYSNSPQSTVPMSVDADFTFIIRSEDFRQLENPFAPYEEHVMDNEAMFFGRSALIRQITDMIRKEDGGMNYGRAFALYGQTRTGKTSLLLHLKKSLTQHYGGDVLIWEIGNLGDKEVAATFTSNFIYSLLETGKMSILRNPEVSQLVREAGLTPPSREVLQHPESAQTLFSAYMQKLNEILRESGRIIVLIIDEFTYLHEYIKSGRIPEEFMRFWKAMLQNNCMFAIVAGQDDMPEFMREYPNEFACMELVKLNYLAESDAKALIKTPLEKRNHRENLFREDGGIDEIYSLTAGSAYLTIILCSKLVEYVNDKGAYIITKGIINDFLSTRVLGPDSFLLDKHFEPQIDERGHIDEFHQINESILLSIARLSQTAGYARLSNITCTAATTEALQFYLDRLVDRNVLVREGRDGYRIYVKLLEKWLIDTKGE